MSVRRVWIAILLVGLLLLISYMVANSANYPKITTAACHLIVVTWEQPPIVVTMDNSDGYVWIYRQDNSSPAFARLQYMNGLYNTHTWYALLPDFPPDHYNAFGYVEVDDHYYYTNVVLHRCGAWMPLVSP